MNYKLPESGQRKFLYPSEFTCNVQFIKKSRAVFLFFGSLNIFQLSFVGQSSLLQLNLLKCIVNSAQVDNDKISIMSLNLRGPSTQ
jgi:hypothetical protein